MKTLRIFLLGAIMSISLMSSAMTVPPVSNSDSELRNRVIELIDNPEFTLDQEAVAHIEFQINAQGEIVVISVQSEDNQLDSYIKSRLNYKDTKIKNLLSGVPYFIDLRFEIKK